MILELAEQAVLHTQEDVLLTRVVFIKELKSKHPVSFDTERELLKSVFIRALFCKNDSTDEYYLKLKEELPNFMRVLETLKEEDNAHLSRLLQNIESHCIIDYVTKKIAKEYPENGTFYDSRFYCCNS